MKKWPWMITGNLRYCCSFRWLAPEGAVVGVGLAVIQSLYCFKECPSEHQEAVNTSLSAWWCLTSCKSSCGLLLVSPDTWAWVSPLLELRTHLYGTFHQDTKWPAEDVESGTEETKWRRVGSGVSILTVVQMLLFLPGMTNHFPVWMKELISYSYPSASSWFTPLEETVVLMLGW